MITPTQLNYYLICPRKLWLFSHHIRMEHTSDLVADGKLTGQTAYKNRAAKGKELDLGIAKIDHYEAKTKTVHEVKHSNKKEEAHVAQLKYYLYLLEQAGIEGAKGVLEYPEMRERQEVSLEAADCKELDRWLAEAETIIRSSDCPPLLPRSKCSKCAYYEFCWSE
jgi:CRISPR-associated exonuclease Cas4